MSIARLWNHSASVYREPSAVESRDALGFVEAAPVLVQAGTGSNCRPDQNWMGGLANHGPGEQQANNRRWLLDKGLDVRERDVLALTAGPEAGLQLRVLSVSKPADRRGHHHTEVHVEVWTGELAT